MGGALNLPEISRDREGFDRVAFHGEFNRSATAFFRAHLGAQRSGDR